MTRSKEELIESSDRVNVTIQRLHCDLEYQLNHVIAGSPMVDAINSYLRRVNKYIRLLTFLNDTITKIEYAEWVDNVNNEIYAITEGLV